VKLFVYVGCAVCTVAQDVVAVRSLHVADLDDLSTTEQTLWTPSVTITVYDRRRLVDHHPTFRSGPP
jgi:hypothetical protein